MVESKELKYKPTPEGNLFEVYYEGGGQLPDELSGRYNSHKAVQDAIQRYLSKKPAKRRYNGSSNNDPKL